MPSTTSASEFWSAHLSTIEQRGISVAEYAREHDLSAQSLYGWRSQQRQAVAAKPRVRFAEVATPPARTSGIRVQLDGATLEFDELPDATWLATLLVSTSIAR